MISGLGFITIDAGAKVIVRVPKHVDVILRNSILLKRGDKSEICSNWKPHFSFIIAIDASC